MFNLNSKVPFAFVCQAQCEHMLFTLFMECRLLIHSSYLRMCSNNIIHFYGYLPLEIEKVLGILLPTIRCRNTISSSLSVMIELLNNAPFYDLREDNQTCVYKIRDSSLNYQVYKDK